VKHVKQKLSIMYRAAFGLRPVLRKARELILRPVRFEAATLAEAISQIGRANDSNAQEIRAFRSQHVEDVAALRAQLARVEVVTDLEERIQTAQADAARTALLARHIAGLRERLHALEAQLRLSQQLLFADPQLPIPCNGQSGPALISVILPTYNRASAVIEAIESVRAQSLSRWELIVVDDGSTDGTDLAVAHFATDARIRILRQEHRGVCAARNRGLAVAQAEYVSFLDSDCLYYPGFLEAAVRALKAEPSLALVYGAVVTDAHNLPEGRLLFRPFDRNALQKGNFIDANAIAARREAINGIGGFDESLDRLVDWDLVLRATQDKPAKPIPVLAARYRVLDDHRVTANASNGVNLFRIRRKNNSVPVMPRPPRVLYLVWHYPQLSESYIEAELRVMRRWGVEIGVWGEVHPAAPYDSDVPVFGGRAEDAINAFRPDLIHIHWLTFASSRKALLAGTGLPVTLRGHGFEVSRDILLELLAEPWLQRLYGFPHQVRLLDANHPRMRSVVCGFDTTMFAPQRDKNRKLVVRTSAGLPSKDLGLFFEVAARRPEYRFVLAAVTCNDKESYIGELHSMNARLGSPVDLRTDVSRDQIAQLLGEAGIYLHTLLSPGAAGATPIGMPISIAEAMATGAVPIVKNLPELTSYVGDAGLSYTDLDHVDRVLAELLDWSDVRWRDQWHRSVDRAYSIYADEVALRPIYDDWISTLRPRLLCPSESSPHLPRTGAVPLGS
jgi:glycosyltransferase involved in cell wall biosynthesis